MPMHMTMASQTHHARRTAPARPWAAESEAEEARDVIGAPG